MKATLSFGFYFSDFFCKLLRNDNAQRLKCVNLKYALKVIRESCVRKSHRSFSWLDKSVRLENHWMRRVQNNTRVRGYHQTGRSVCFLSTLGAIISCLNCESHPSNYTFSLRALAEIRSLLSLLAWHSRLMVDLTSRTPKRIVISIENPICNSIRTNKWLFRDI